VDERTIEKFWQEHPCGEGLIVGVDARRDYEQFFQLYDAFRYGQAPHILTCLDRLDVTSKVVLEVGLGEGADTEQLVRRGARLSGVDLTEASIERVRLRFAARGLTYERLEQASVLDLPWPDDAFDLVFSHGVLHHVPDIVAAQREIARVLRPTGELVVMLYARNSLNYRLSIFVLRRLALTILYPLVRGRLITPSPMLAQHVENARELGLRKYLRMETFLSHNTDGPANPFSRVYKRTEIEHDFADFSITRMYKTFMHAPPLPVSRVPLSRWLGWNLWVHLSPRKAKRDARNS
jgi:SAM-dependent methyltransferase